MKVQAQITEKLKQGLAPIHLEVINESSNHNVPPGSETHFKIVATSSSFDGKNLVERHRQVYALLAEEISKKKVHALAIHTFTPAEWEKEKMARSSPECLGGSKKK